MAGPLACELAAATVIYAAATCTGAMVPGAVVSPHVHFPRRLDL